MTARVSPYLTFAGNARQAMRFYQSAFGGDLDITTFGDLQGSTDTAQDELIAHATLRGTTGVVLMASDRTPGDEVAGGSTSITLGGDEAELATYWERLSESGSVTVPFARSPWGALYGRCTDKFGTDWLVNVTAPATP
ncbi:VOC family protein [Micromonospora sp. WMMD961]|uniref:VOC family protein n=1 Tax=Micromonospora sp. WMMD961 TaxID=3016100 RepID=UPI002417A91E|nr:VOC family protein [Micromonospora sp. WMMD961]MDG4780441.1 VOC family protein [Micromonospora sp. WMMD961]